ncbi:MAG: cupin domain-containing protein [Thermoleophilia bacterium]|nr:cupin domain-containing protein [Thermoleophilia bacterium]
MGIAHWDDVERHHRAKGEMDATWQLLGRAAGTNDVGVNRVRVAPGKLPTPPHSHGASEEVYFVLGGSGLAWQDGAIHEVGPGDCVIHTANHFEHTFIAGHDGLDYLVYGTRHPTEIGWLPRSRAIRIGWPWVEGREDDPWDVEAQVPPLDVGEPSPRPDNILHVGEVELERWGAVVTAPLATRERSQLAGFHWERIDPAGTGSPPHCHSEEEEVFVMLEGDGTLELWPSPRAEERGAVREDLPIRAGHVVARPPGTAVGHAFRAGSSGLTMLIYGTRKPNDLAYYPRSKKINFRGLGVIGRIEHLEYWDGEPVEATEG